MRYSLSDLEKRFSDRPNARWKSIHAELRRLEMEEALKLEGALTHIRDMMKAEKEIHTASEMIAKAVASDLSRPSWFDRLMGRG
jgi:hypothetical protein